MQMCHSESCCWSVMCQTMNGSCSLHLLRANSAEQLRCEYSQLILGLPVSEELALFQISTERAGLFCPQKRCYVAAAE